MPIDPWVGKGILETFLKNQNKTPLTFLKELIFDLGGLISYLEVYGNLGFDSFVGGGKGKFPYRYYQNILESHKL